MKQSKTQLSSFLLTLIIFSATCLIPTAYGRGQRTVSYDSSMEIGMGWMHHELEESAYNPSHIENVKTIDQALDYEYEICKSQHELDKFKSLHLNGNVSYGPFSASAKYEDSSQIKMSENDVLVIAVIKKKFPNTMGQGFKAIDKAKSYLKKDSTSLADWEQTYGTHYIAGFKNISSAFLIAHAHTESKSAQNEVAAELEASYKGLSGSASASIKAKKSINEIDSTYTFDLTCHSYGYPKSGSTNLAGAIQWVQDFDQDATGVRYSAILEPYSRFPGMSIKRNSGNPIFQRINGEFNTALSDYTAMINKLTHCLDHPDRYAIKPNKEGYVSRLDIQNWLTRIKASKSFTQSSQATFLAEFDNNLLKAADNAETIMSHYKNRFNSNIDLLQHWKNTLRIPKNKIEKSVSITLEDTNKNGGGQIAFLTSEDRAKGKNSKGIMTLRDGKIEKDSKRRFKVYSTVEVGPSIATLRVDLWVREAGADWSFWNTQGSKNGHWSTNMYETPPGVILTGIIEPGVAVTDTTVLETRQQKNTGVLQGRRGKGDQGHWVDDNSIGPIQKMKVRIDNYLTDDPTNYAIGIMEMKFRKMTFAQQWGQPYTLWKDVIR